MSKIIDKRWKIIRDIGEGGQSFVYLVEDLNDRGNFYALKRFKNIQRKQRIDNEILINKNLYSLGASVPEIFDDGFDGKYIYMVSKYYPNGNLEEYTNSNTLSFSDKRKLILSICAKTCEINNFGYAHRDLKPSNILLDDNFDVVICDLGLSKKDGEDGFTPEGEPIGSVHYLHKEAFNPNNFPTEKHKAFDAYSFGKILYKVLTGNYIEGFNKLGDGDYSLDNLKEDGVESIVIQKLTILVNRLLDDDLNNLAQYWALFPEELEKTFLINPKGIEITDEMCRKISASFLNSSKPTTKTSSISKHDTDLVIDQICSSIEENKIFQFLKSSIEDTGTQKIAFKKQANLRELLEGVGVKTYYGCEPLTDRGRKQSLVLGEFYVEIPKGDCSVIFAISLINLDPKIKIILCMISKKGQEVDIIDDTIEINQFDHLSIHNDEIISDFNNYFSKHIQEV